MELSHLHFEHPVWLLAALALPLVWITYFLFYRADRPYHQLEKFIDRHLLPYLLKSSADQKSRLWKYLLLWTIAWVLLVMALAGPRWSFREIDTFSRDQSLVVLLDLSESMNAADVKPSRLVRAKQKIEDLLNASKGVKIGLVAFAADPHMVAPITDDKETIRHLLPTLGTDLVYVQGSKLSSAFDMAAAMLAAEPGNNKSILVISDGGFEDASAIVTAKKLADKGIVIHAMGVGTTEGAPVRNHAGDVIKKNGASVISRLEKERFREISKTGNGRYLEAHYSDHDEQVILEDLDKRAEAQVALGRKNRIWDERFYLLIIPVLPIFLWWFRRGGVFATYAMLFLSFGSLRAESDEYFYNSEQRGQQALEQGDCKAAADLFQDPYRKGVAYYKAGDFEEAEKWFRQSTRDEVAASAAYNVGNALVQQQKLKKAMTAYENVLKKWPGHIKAKDNLEIVKKMLEEQKQQGGSSDDQDNNDDQQDENGESQDKKNAKDQNKEKDSPNEGSDKNEQNNTEQSEEKEQESGESQDQEESSKEEESAAASAEEQDQQDAKEANAAQAEESANEEKDSASQEDRDADLWLNRISSDPKTFMKNKFYIESKKNAATEGMDPW